MFEAYHINKIFGKMANIIYCVWNSPQLTFQTRLHRKQHPSASPFLPYLCRVFMRALHSKSVIKIVSRGRKALLVLKVGDGDDGNDLPDDVLSRFMFISCPSCVLWVLSFSLRSCSTSFFLFPLSSLSAFFLFFPLFFHRVFL